MKTEYLKEFVTLAHYGNFHSAAEKLFISQPTLSNHIKTLEREVGFELFDRARDNELTVAGSLLLDAAQSALMTIDAALESCRRVSDAEEDAYAPARVAVFALTNRVHDALEKSGAYSHVYADYDIRKPLLHSFVQDTADVMITYDPDSIPTLKAEVDALGLSYAYVGTEPCSVAMRKSHPLANVPLTRENLRRAKVIVLGSAAFGYWKRALANMLGSAMEFEFEVVPLQNTDAMRGFDLHDGILIAPTYMVDGFFAPRESYLTRSEIDGLPLRVKRSVLWRPRPENPNIEHVVAFLIEHMADEGR